MNFVRKHEPRTKYDTDLFCKYQHKQEVIAQEEMVFNEVYDWHPVQEQECFDQEDGNSLEGLVLSDSSIELNDEDFEKFFSDWYRTVFLNI